MATTIDHQPARVFFRAKRMPDETLFPACEPCQSISRPAEALMSVLVTPEAQTDADLHHWNKRLRDARRRYPAAFAEIIPSEALRADLARQLTCGPPEGYSEKDMLVLDPAIWQPHFEIIARKLGLALHYKAHGRPLSRSGVQLAYLVPNAHLDDFDDDFLREATSLHLPSHGTESLASQMTIRWAAGTEPATAAFRVRLHSSIWVYSITCEDADRTPLAGLANNLFRPLP